MPKSIGIIGGTGPEGKGLAARFAQAGLRGAHRLPLGRARRRGGAGDPRARRRQRPRRANADAADGRHHRRHGALRRPGRHARGADRTRSATRSSSRRSCRWSSRPARSRWCRSRTARRPRRCSASCPTRRSSAPSRTSPRSKLFDVDHPLEGDVIVYRRRQGSAARGDRADGADPRPARRQRRPALQQPLRRGDHGAAVNINRNYKTETTSRSSASSIRRS